MIFFLDIIKTVFCILLSIIFLFLLGSHFCSIRCIIKLTQPNLSTEANEILAYLKQQRINELYHFTAVENLPFILRAGGLLSKQTMQRQSIWPPIPGGNQLSHDLDERQGNWNKVCLSFTPYIPMGYHRKRQIHLCYFVIRPEVAAWSSVVFTDTNAASNGQIQGLGIAGLKNVNFSVVRGEFTPDKQVWQRYVQAEVLVPDRIPLQSVSQIAFLSEASLAHGTRICGESHSLFGIRQNLFADSRRESTPNFPHVKSFSLIDVELTEQNVFEAHQHKTEFYRSQSNYVSWRSSLFALTGTTGKIDCIRAGYSQEVEFETSNSYTHWGSLAISDLQDGLYSIEYRLDNILFASVDFEIIPG